MKEMDSLETRLHSWRPRRPSSGLKRRLFGSSANVLSGATKFLGWLAPVAACALLTLQVFNSGNYNNPSRPMPAMAMVLSNQNYAAYAPDNFREAQNGLSSITFEWTNRSGSTSSIAPFSRDMTH